MRVIALRTIKAFVESRPEYDDAHEPLLAWYRQALKADWASPADVKRQVGNASILKDGRVVFNVAGNKYRLVACVDQLSLPCPVCALRGNAFAVRQD